MVWSTHFFLGELCIKNTKTEMNGFKNIVIICVLHIAGKGNGLPVQKALTS